MELTLFCRIFPAHGWAPGEERIDKTICYVDTGTRALTRVLVKWHLAVYQVLLLLMFTTYNSTRAHQGELRVIKAQIWSRTSMKPCSASAKKKQLLDLENKTPIYAQKRFTQQIRYWSFFQLSLKDNHTWMHGAKLIHHHKLDELSFISCAPPILDLNNAKTNLPPVAHSNQWNSHPHLILCLPQ